ncbi:MAG: hypothetical protein ACRYHQ_14575 [Janthinobacterium lividum]
MIARRTALMAPLGGVLLAGCSLLPLSDTQQQELAADLVIAVGVAQDVTVLLPLLGAPAPAVVAAQALEATAQAALKAWQQAHHSTDAVQALSTASTLYAQLPTADAAAVAQLSGLLTAAQAKQTLPAALALARALAALRSTVSAQLSAARLSAATARARHIQELRQ